MKIFKISLVIVFFINFLSAQIDKKFEAKLDSIITKTMEVFKVPGVAVAIVKDSMVIYNKGFGEKKAGSGEKVNNETLFGIASNTKAFTAAVLAILVDEGKIKWDDKVTRYIPEFQMSDPYVTAEMTIRDLLTHRSGLSTGMGDLLAWPETEFSKKEIIDKLKYMKPSFGFRTRFGYSNILYMVAGEIVKSVTGKEWNEFIVEKIFTPLDMKSSLALMKEVKTKSNRAFPHVEIDGKLNCIELDVVDNVASAGSIQSNTNDMSKWMIMQLNRGKIPGKQNRIFSKRQSDEMWRPQTILYGSPDKNPISQSNFSMYGFGWNIQDVRGKYVVSHTGGLVGMLSKVTLIPEMGLGVVVLTNQQEGAAFTIISNVVTEYYMTGEIKDLITPAKERSEKMLANVNKELKENQEKRNADSKPSRELKSYAGQYTDVWYGNVKIDYNDSILELSFEKSPKLKGKLKHYQYDTFIVEWNYREIIADCYVTFSLDKDGLPETIKMEPVSPLTDFSFDFQDLELHRK